MSQPVVYGPKTRSLRLWFYQTTALFISGEETKNPHSPARSEFHTYKARFP